MARFFSFRKWFDRILRPTPVNRPKKHAKRTCPRLEELENRLAPATTLSIADASVLEPAAAGTVNMDFTVTRTGDVSAPLTVGYTTVPGTAHAARDFTPMTGSTTFAAGAATATVAIPVFGNGVYNNPSLTFAVKLTGLGPPLTLAGAQTFATGSNPVSVAVGDVNGDGNPDVVAANFFDNTVSVLLNTTPPGAAALSFAAQQTFSTGSYPSSVVLADINGDGKLDIVTANFLDNSASVLLNTTPVGASTASFAAKQAFTIGTSASAVAMGDVNGDGKPDLVFANYNDGTVSVLLNTTATNAASAAFAPQQTFATGRGPQAVALGDVNGDNKPDLVVANFLDNTVSVLLSTTATNAASASFASQQTFATGHEPKSVALVDINGDGKPDIVAANQSDSSVSVLLNTTAAAATLPVFAAQQTFATGSLPVAVAAKDLNGDGRPDLVITNETGTTVSALVNTTLPGAAAAAFTTQQAFATGSLPFAVAASDVNGDGQPDVVVANRGDGTVSVLLNAPGTITRGTATGTITENDSPPTVSFAAATETVNENGGTFSVTVNLSAASSVNTTIPFTASGSADSGSNYSGLTASPLIILAGHTSATITGTLIDDNIFESAPTTVVFSLGTPTNAVLGTTPVNTLTIQDSDTAPTVSFAAAAETVNENAGSFSLTVNLSAAVQVPVTIPFTLGGTAVSGTNYSGLTASPLVIAAGHTSATITGTLIDDGVFESANNALVFTLGTPTNAILGATSVNTLTIQETTAAPTVSFASATQTVSENGGTFSVTVNLSAASGSPVNVPFTLGGTAVAGTNYSGETASPLVIAAGQTSGTITGTLTDDGKFDTANQTLILTLGTPTGATLGATTLDTLTIQESDQPPTVSFANAAETVNENAGTFSVTVNLSAASNVDTTIPFTVAGTAASGTNYSSVTASPLVIAAGSTFGTITGTLIDDGIVEPTNSTILFALGTPTNATLGAITANTLTIQETNTTGPTVSFASGTQSVNENAGTFSVTVNLSAASGASVSIPFTLGGTAVSGSNYSGVTASPLVIAAGQTSATITGTVIDDGKFDTVNQTLTLTLGTPSGAALGATTVDTLTIQESDQAPTVSFASAAEMVNENGGTFSVTVNLSAPSNVATTVPFTVGGTAVSGTNYSGVTASPLVIAVGQTSGTITGSLIDDGVFASADNTLVFTLGTPTNATLGATPGNTLTVHESDTAPTVSFVAAAETLAENAGTFSVTVNLSAATGVPVTIPFTVGGTAVPGANYSGVTASPLVIPAGSTSGIITGTILDDGVFRSANNTLTVTLGAPTNAALGGTPVSTLTIQEADQAPTVSFASATQTVSENGGTFSVTVNLSAPSQAPITVPFTLGGTAISGTHFSGVTASPLHIPAGQTSATITGTLIDDGSFDAANRTLAFTLGTPTNAALGTTTADTLTIQESDQAPTVSFSSSAVVVDANTGVFSVAVNLSAASNADTTIPFTLGGTAVSGTHYTGVTASPLVIPARQTTGTITGTLVANSVVPQGTTIIFTLGTPTNATLGAITTKTFALTPNVTPPTVTFTSAAETVNASAGSFSVTVNLSAASPLDAVIPFTLGGSAVAGADYSGVTPSPLTIPAGSTLGTITGTLLQNPGSNALPTLTFTLGTPTGATLGSVTSNTLSIMQALTVGDHTLSYRQSTFTISLPATGTFGVSIAPTQDYVLKQRFGLAFAGTYYQDYGGQNEKWLTGAINQYGNRWYFITPAGNLSAWNGAANQAAGAPLASLDTLYWAQPNRLTSAQANEVTGAIANNVLTITTSSNYAGQAVVSLTTTVPAGTASTQQFTLSFVNQPPVLTHAPGGNLTTTAATPVSVHIGLSDADGDTLNYSAVGGSQGLVLEQSLGLRLQGSLFQNYGGQNEKWLQSTSGSWYFVKPNGTLWKWDGALNQATGTQTAALDPVYYYHPDLLYHAPSGDLAHALNLRLGLSFAGSFFLNYGGANERWLLGNDGWYFVKPDGTFWKWDGTRNHANGTLMATLSADYYANIQRLFNAPLSTVAVNISGSAANNTLALTLTPAAGFIGQFWVAVKATDASQSVFDVFAVTVTS